MIISEIEKKVINILPTSSIEFDGIDYSILKKRKNDWIKLSEVTHSIVLILCKNNETCLFKTVWDESILS